MLTSPAGPTSRSCTLATSSPCSASNLKFCHSHGAVGGEGRGWWRVRQHRPTEGPQSPYSCEKEQKLPASHPTSITPCICVLDMPPLLHMASKLPPTPPEIATSIDRESCPPETSESSLVSGSDSEGLLLLSSGPGETPELVCSSQSMLVLQQISHCHYHQC